MIKWKTSNGAAIPVILMETTHLHHTIRLIWNTFMPEALRLGHEHGTVFNNPKIHSAKYISSVVSAMYDELTKNRSDELTDWMLDELEHMQLARLLAVIKEHFEEHLNDNCD